MLSKYTLYDLDVIFSVHPIIKHLTSSERTVVYNQAQDAIADLIESDIYLLTNYTVIDGKLVSSDTKEPNRINELTSEDKESLKLGTFSYGQLLDILQLDNGFSSQEKEVIVNIAQDILASFKNDYDEFGYYQLWYNIDTIITYKRTEEPRFKTNAIHNVEPITINSTNLSLGDNLNTINTGGTNKVYGSIPFITNFSYKLFHIVDSILDESRFRTSLSYYTYPSATYEDKVESRFRTTLAYSISTPVLYNQEKESRFRTSLSTYITTTITYSTTESRFRTTFTYDVSAV